MKINHLTLFLLLGLAASCSKEDNKPSCNYEFEPNTRFFEFVSRGSNEIFIAWTADTQVINQALAQLQLPEDQRNMHINGELARMPEGCRLNKAWSWYFLPKEWHLAEVSIELCDGSPGYVEENLSEYLRIGGYCPWGSFVNREITAPF